MMTQVRVRYSNGALTPLEPLDLEEGEEMVVHIEDRRPSPNGSEDAPQPAPLPTKKQETLLEMFERLRNSVPAEAWENLPTDGAKNYKRYLYGRPKEEE